MPIRTHRGRAAVYRTVWGWPLRSPRHLAVAALVLAAVAVGIGIALPDEKTLPLPQAQSTSDNPFDPASRTATAEAAARAPSTTPVPQAPPAALQVAESWVRAFLNAPEGITAEQWAAQLRPYTTDEVFPELRTVDPANVPDAQVTGPPRTISSGSGSAEIDVPTTDVVVRLLLVSTPDGWRVSAFEQAS